MSTSTSASSSSSSSSPPKAVLYWNPTSVWSTVPRLALIEMGYRSEDVVLKEVNIAEGANFSPPYLRVNPHGTIPTLVVPVLSSVPGNVETQFRSFKDTLSILAFLDSARGTTTSSSSSLSQPSKRTIRLSPATVQGKNLSEALTLAVHLSTADPNFLLVAARTPHELMQKENGFPGRWLKMRQDALSRFSLEQEEGSPQRRFLTKKAEANQTLYNVYYAPSGKEADERRRVFFAASLRAWTVGVPDVLRTLEEDMVGCYSLGDELAVSDLHIIAWLCRLVFLSQGGPNAEGMVALENQINVHGSAGRYTIGPKVRMFWASWLKRESFQEVYVSGLH